MSKIPEGATHTAPDGTYRMARGGIWYGYADGDWAYIGGAAPHCCTKIQAEPEWSAGGIPKVGVVCEFMKLNAPPKANGEWTKGDVRYVSDCTIVIGGDRCEHVHHPRNLLYRSAKTDEQIATEKRDAAIKEMQRLVGSCNTFPFAELYDYGYRLQVEK
jgi:hypothetical protein